MPKRKIRLFALHGHINGAPLDYSAFFRWLSDLGSAPTRRDIWDDLAFVIESSTRGRVKTFTVLSGDPAEFPLLYDEASNSLVSGPSDGDTWSASRTRFVVDPASRLLALETRRAGVTPKNLALYFSYLARDLGYANNLSLDLSPVPSDTFEVELAQLTRIREASIVVIEPNPGWIDHPDDLSELASSSNGHRATATVTAPRNGSLSTSSGIVAIIKDQVRRHLPSVKKATVKGTKLGQEAEAIVSTDEHPREASVVFAKGATDAEIGAEVAEEATRLIAEVQEESQ